MSRSKSRKGLIALLYLTAMLPTHAFGSDGREWYDAALHGARDSRLPAPAIARALAIVSTCMYDAWAAYDGQASGTQLGDVLRRPARERTDRNKEEAVSYAAFRALSDVLPVDIDSLYTPLLKQSGFDPGNTTTSLKTPAGIANVACAAVLEYRHRDGSNQLGDLAPGPYTDWTHYTAHNKPTVIPVLASGSDPDHWQPLIYVNGAGDRVTQGFAGAQWGRVTPFALGKGDQFRGLVASVGPARFGSPEYVREIEQTVAISAGLTDREKVISEYWTDGQDSEQPPGHWIRIAEWMSARDHHSLDDDIKLYFVLTNAMFDAGIAAWDAKAAFDAPRPITAVSAFYRGKTIQAWGGPGKGTVPMDGAHWIPYQEADSPTPPFPEFVSGHSAYSAAAASILRHWSGSDLYGGSATVVKGTSRIEPGFTPHIDVTLHWRTFTEAAEEAGMSRRYGGIHFQASDEAGRLLGTAVAEKVWAAAGAYWQGRPEEHRLLTTTLLQNE